jgi:hypothetical protein
MMMRKTKRILFLLRVAACPARVREPALVRAGYLDHRDQAHDPAACPVRRVEEDSRPQADQQGVGVTKKVKRGAASDGKPVVHPLVVDGVVMMKKTMIIHRLVVVDFLVPGPVETSPEDQRDSVDPVHQHAPAVCPDHP